MTGSWLDLLFACQDLILVFSGILWFVVAVSASCLETEKKHSIRLLAQFFFCQSIIDWFKMAFISAGLNQWLLFGYSTLLAINLFLLLKIFFTDEENRISRLADFSINLGSGILIVLSILWIFGGLSLNLLSMILGFSVLVSLMFLLKFSRFNFFMAIGIALITVSAAIFSVSWPAVLARLLLSAVVALLMARNCCRSLVVDNSADLMKNSPYFISVTMILWLFSVLWLSGLAEKEIRENIFLKAETVAGALAPQDFKDLPFEKNNHSLEEFKRIRKYLTEYGRLFPDLRGIYTLKIEKGKLVFGPENYAENDPQASPIGTEYLKPDPRVFKVFETGRSVVFGPFSDEYGTFVSAFAPVICPVDGKALAVIGIDVDASRYNSMIAQSRIWLNLIFCLTGMVLILTVVFFNYRNTRKPEQVSQALNQIESISTVIVGILASTVVFIGSANYENYLAQSELARVATLISSRISENASRLKIHLDDLSIMLDSGMNMDEFRRLTQNSCQREFPFAEFFNPFSSAEKKEMALSLPELNPDQEDTSLRYISDKGIIFKQIAPNQKAEAFFYQKKSGAASGLEQFFGYRVKLDELINLQNKLFSNSKENLKMQLYSLKNPAMPLAVFPSVEMQPLPKDVLISRNPCLYFPLFIMNESLVISFSHIDHSHFFLTNYGPSLILSLSCLLVFLIVAAMFRMARNQNFHLEVQVHKRTHELGKSEKRFRDLVESLSDWVWELDLEGRYVYCFCSIVRDGQLGIERMVGQKFYDLPTIISPQQNHDFFNALVNHPRAFYDFENSYQMTNGETVIFSNSGLPVYDENGNLVGFRGISRDITEKRRAERELRESRELYMLAVKGTQD
ncbi:MAG: PAS domain-containing protein, partial [Candidatus Riflebacteria bacterium]